MKKSNFVHALVESAILLAFGTVMSVLKLLDLPYGGSVTLASMLPLVIVSYRHGLGWGMLAGLAYGIGQQLLGLKNLGYVTGWVSVVAVILLDYIVAYVVVGLGGVFRKSVKHQGSALALGSILVAFLRFLCHFVSGATVWAELPIPTGASLAYSAVYNATYMIPETIILAIVAYYIGSAIDFRGERINAISSEEKSPFNLPIFIGGLLVTFAFVFLVVMVFGKLQNPETGEFMLEGLKDVNWLVTGLVSGLSFIAGVVFLVIGRKDAKRPAEAA